MKLVMIVGFGGCGKTTLSAALGTALSDKGYSVGILSVDPARRLPSVFGLQNNIENWHSVSPGLDIQLLDIPSYFNFLIDDSYEIEEALKIRNNKIFQSLMSGFTTTPEVFGSSIVGMYQKLKYDYLIVDTAPSLHALDFLENPEKILNFLDGKMIRWLKMSAKSVFLQKSVFKILEGLDKVGGKGFFKYFGELLVSMEKITEEISNHYQIFAEWLQKPETQFLLVGSPEASQSWDSYERFYQTFKDKNLPLTHFLMNRCLSVDSSEPFNLKEEQSPDSTYFNHFVSHYSFYENHEIQGIPNIKVPLSHKKDNNMLLNIGERILHAVTP